MSNPPTDAGKKRLKRKADVLTEASPVPRPQSREGSQSFTRMETRQAKRIKQSARDLLATLSGRRISITEITFSDDSAKDGGTYADVAVATLVRASGTGEERSTVAVKKLRFVLSGDMTEEKFLRVFVNELRLLEKLSHPNIVKIIGFVEDFDNTENRIAWLVFPWEDNGHLRKFLRSGKWELPERVSLIRDVACGLEYLHTRKPPICHGDLKSLNILVNSRHRALITDFGSAREIQELEANSAPPPAASTSRVPTKEHPQFNLTASDTALTLTGPQCSFRWAPPDVLKGGPLDLTSDIWALGWIAWEGITDSHPFEELSVEWDVTLKVMDGQLPLLDDHGRLSQIRHLCSMMLSCWRSEPNERPSATECYRTLGWIPAIIPLLKDGENSTTRSAMLFLRLGEVHRLQNRHEEATKAYEQGLVIARSTTDHAAEALLSVQLAENQRMQTMHVEAEAGYTRAMAIFTSIGDDVGRAGALCGLGEVQKMRSNYDDAEASLNQAMTIYTRIGIVSGRARALRGLGDIQRARSNYADADALYTQAIAIYRSIGSQMGQANALYGLGNVQRLRSNYVDAEASYSQAIAIYARIGGEHGRARTLLDFGDIQLARSSYVDAEASYTQAMSLYARINFDQGRAQALRRLEDVQRMRSNHVDAEASYT